MGFQEEHSSEDGLWKAAKATGKVINVIAAILTLVVVLAAIWIPPEIGRGGTPTERTWQGIGVLVLLCAIAAVVRKRAFSLLYLGLACAFFFVSCAANFHWKGG
jgi:hypothetical protein